MDDGKVQCKYGKNCYQRNAAHLSKFSHPPSVLENQDSVDDRPNSRRRARTPSPPSSNENSKKLRSRSPSGPSYNLRSPKHPTNANNTADTTVHSLNNKNILKSKTMLTVKPKTINTLDGPSQEKDLDFINDCFDKETRFSQRAEYKQMLQDPQQFIKHKFLVEMPKDFYLLWDFCKANAKKEQKPENIFVKFGLKLLGPFDVLAGM